MKIAACHNFLNQKRGAELAFIQMVLGLKKRGHDVDVYVFSISDYYLQEFQSAGIHVINLNLMEPLARNFFNGVLFYSKTYLALKRVSTDINRKYDVAFIHHYFLTPFIMPFLTIPAVYYCQEVIRNYHEKVPGHIKQPLPVQIIETYFEQRNVMYADLVLCNSYYMREVCMSIYGIFPRTVYLGVDSTRFRNCHTTRENTVLSIGAIAPLKQHDFIIRSIGCIPHEKRPKLLIVGNGPAATISELRNLAAGLEVCLEIRNVVSDNELVTIYNSVKMTALAYILEPFGLTAIESLSCETPVIAIREGGLRESITPECGILTERSEIDFARAIEYLLDHPEIASEMGIHGRERVRNQFSWDCCCSNLEKCILSVEKTQR